MTLFLSSTGWTRILVEKPFGSDLANAKHLEEKLSKLFNEEQIYRIDHYLAKSAIQNIISFRFSNVLFEDKWNKDYVDAVYIKLFESFGVSDRGAFFDSVGALRDVGQNHALQMLALVAMDRPEKLSAEALRTNRASVLQALQIPQKEDAEKNTVQGQYDGYRNIRNVSPSSNTETYFALKTHIDNERWSGVPFYIEHGKSLSENKTEITIRFRSSKNCVCSNPEKHHHVNILTFTIAPEQKITLQFWVRKQGLKYELEPRELVFDRNHTDPESGFTDAYEEVLFDALCGDQTLFVSSAEQEAAWKYITTILTLWGNDTPIPYETGSTGPESSLKQEIEHVQKLFTK
jgi:glucose-6-phosphate 1-dehydrogenase